MIQALQRGNEVAFALIQARYSRMMLVMAHMYVSDWGIAEDIVQDTWLAVFRGIAGFEGRSSLKT